MPIQKSEGLWLTKRFFVGAPLILERGTYSHLWLKGLAWQYLKKNVEQSNLVITVSESIAEHIRQQTNQHEL